MKENLSTVGLFLAFALSGNEAWEGKADEVDSNAIVLELDYGLPAGWEMERAWFELVNKTDQIQTIVDGSRWYDTVDFKQWKELVPVSQGLWMLFYQEIPPQFGIGPPFIGNSYSTNRILHNLFITYFMYGSSSMHVYAEGVFVQSIDNSCGKHCPFDFVTTKVALQDVPYSPGKFSFRIMFNATNPGDFILIDKIVVDDVQLTTGATGGTSPGITDAIRTTATSSETEDLTKSTSTVANTDDPTGSTTTTEWPEDPTIVLTLDDLDDLSSITGWNIERLWFEEVNTTDQIQEIVDGSRWYDHIDFKKWEELSPVSQGLWMLFYQELPPVFGIGPPCIGYNGATVSSHQHSLFITYFMYGSSSMHIYADGTLIKSIENSCGESCSFDFLTTKIPLIDLTYPAGAHNFSIILNATTPGDFILIDKIEVDGAQVTPEPSRGTSEGTTEPSESSTVEVATGFTSTAPSTTTSEGTTDFSGAADSTAETEDPKTSTSTAAETTEGMESTVWTEPEDPTIVLRLDKLADLPGSSWVIEEAWFEEVNTTDQIQGIVNSSEWYDTIDFVEWEELNPVSSGLWILFYQKMAPIFGLGPPYIGYEGAPIFNYYHNIYITYFMYGSSSMHIYADNGIWVESIENPCGEKCSFDFVTTKVALNDVPYSPGKYQFRIMFNATNPGDFILIDKIEADNVQAVTTTQTTGGSQSSETVTDRIESTASSESTPDATGSTATSTVPEEPVESTTPTGALPEDPVESTTPSDGTKDPAESTKASSHETTPEAHRTTDLLDSTTDTMETTEPDGENSLASNAVLVVVLLTSAYYIFI